MRPDVSDIEDFFEDWLLNCEIDFDFKQDAVEMLTPLTDEMRKQLDSIIDHAFQNVKIEGER